MTPHPVSGKVLLLAGLLALLAGCAPQRPATQEQKPVQQAAPTPAPAVPASPAPAATPVHDLTPPPETAPAGGKVSTSLDHIAKPGALVSGKVTFTDGQTAEWYLDQTGRLGMVPPVPGYRPPQADVPVFQQQLQEELAKLGM